MEKRKQERKKISTTYYYKRSLNGKFFIVETSAQALVKGKYCP